jgi:tripartite-type tricarboxylate transporter receptor subunit TctC
VLTAAMADATVRSRFTEFGAEPVTNSPKEFERFIAAEVVKWRDLITKAGIKLDP